MNKRGKTDVEKYLVFGKYTKNCPEYLIKKARAIPHRGVSERYIFNLIKLIKAEFDRRKYTVTVTHNLKQSRLMSAKDVLLKRQRSCGSLATVMASLLRSLGIPTKLIDGYYKGKDKHYAWIEVYLEKKFVPFDVNLRSHKLTKYHKKVGEYVDWSEMKLD